MSRRSGPPYRDIPSTPSPNIRKKANYSIVIISHSGGARQIEVTPAKVRLGAALAAGALLCSGVVGLFAGRHFSTSGPATADTAALSQKVLSLQQELATKDDTMQQELAAKDNTIADREERLKEMEKRLTLLSRVRPTGGLSGSPEQVGGGDSQDEPKRAPLSAGLHSSPPGPGKSTGDTVPVEPDDGAPDVPNPRPEALHPNPSGSRTTPPLNLRFADDVSTLEGTSTGEFSFRLLKDLKDSFFEGYLFVFLTTKDKKGEESTRIFPEKTRLDGDMPRDHRDGKSLSFKSNTRVTVPYPRQEGTTLSGASILLYNEEGKIVLQRRLDRSEIKVLQPKEKSHKPSQPRRRAV